LKYYIIAGEQSGDLHGSNLIKELKKTDPDARFRFWGGDMMQKEAGEPVRHMRNTAFMGFREVLLNLPLILNNIRLCKKDIISYNPDALILIDYPGFNLKMAKYATKKGIKVFYYISPKVWAWNISRVKKIKSYVPHMLTIFPFETEFYEKYGYKVDYVGNPLIDALEDYPFKDEDFSSFVSRNNLEKRPVVALLPGSRLREIEKCLPVMLELIPQYPQYQFVIACTGSVDKAFYERFVKGCNVKLLFDQTYALLKHSRAAIVVSGTATLEAALIGVPQVVCYKTGRLLYFLGKRLVKVPWISLVNLIMKREAVKELIQDQLNVERLSQEFSRIVNEGESRRQMLNDYRRLAGMLGGVSPSRKAACKIYNYLNKGQG